jgi:hypothetical protein
MFVASFNLTGIKQRQRVKEWIFIPITSSTHEPGLASRAILAAHGGAPVIKILLQYFSKRKNNNVASVDRTQYLQIPHRMLRTEVDFSLALSQVS